MRGDAATGGLAAAQATRYGRRHAQPSGACRPTNMASEPMELAHQHADVQNPPPLEQSEFFTRAVGGLTRREYLTGLVTLCESELSLEVWWRGGYAGPWCVLWACLGERPPAVSRLLRVKLRVLWACWAS